MSVTNVNIPTAQSFVLVDTRTGPNKVLFLPAASTIQGRFLSIKDYYGGATASSMTISTTGFDRIDQRGIYYTLASSFGSIALLSDGIRSWNMMGMYEGADSGVVAAGSLVSTWSPSSITNLTLWLDAADSTTFTYSSSSNISTWRDKATGIYASNASTGNQPVYVSSSQNSKGTVYFDATTALRYLDIPAWSFGTTARTLFIVMKNLASAVNNGGILGGYTHWFWDRSNGNNSSAWTMIGVLNIRGAGVADTSYAMPLNEYVVIGITYGSSTITAYKTGTQVLNYGAISSLLDTPNGYRLGGLNNGDDNSPYPYRFYGNIAELITFNRMVNTTERQQLEGYLAWKWGLQATLPAGHPYLSAAP